MHNLFKFKFTCIINAALFYTYNRIYIIAIVIVVVIVGRLMLQDHATSIIINQHQNAALQPNATKHCVQQRQNRMSGSVTLSYSSAQHTSVQILFAVYL